MRAQEPGGRRAGQGVEGCSWLLTPGSLGPGWPDLLLSPKGKIHTEEFDINDGNKFKK